MEVRTARASYSVPSIIAIVAAIASLFTGAFFGFVLAMIAIVFGVIGVLLSLSPNVRGGVMSIFSLVVAGIGVVVAVFKAVAWVFR